MVWGCLLRGSSAGIASKDCARLIKDNILYCHVLKIGKLIEFVESKMTIKEIAEKAEVSAGTVDRVLHNRGEVAKKTKDKILRIIQEGNYEPNLFARQLVLNKEYTIASLLPVHKKEEFWAFPEMGIERSVEELKSFGIRNRIYLFEEEDPLDFERVANEMLRKKPDGLLLAPVIYEKAQWLADVCKEEKIPLVLIDSDIPGSTRLAAIGQDAFRSGKLAAHLLHMSRFTSRMFIINVTHKKNSNSNQIFKERKKGFLAYLQEKAVPAELHEVNLNVEDKDFSVQLRNLVQSFKENDSVFVADSKIHLLAREVDAQHKSGKVRMVGYDLVKKNKEYLVQGTIDFLINQKPELQGYLAIQSLYKCLVLKKTPEDRIFIPIEIVTSENVDYISQGNTF